MKLEVEIIIPEPPSKFRTTAGLVEIEQLSAESLRAIAKEWGETLVKKAKEKKRGKS